MTYLFKQKLNLRELVGVEELRYKVLIYEPESYLSALYAHYLSVHNLDIKHCPNLLNIKEAIAVFAPDLLVFSYDDDIPKQAKVLNHLLACFPNLKVVSIGSDIHNDCLKELMSLGIVSHINRKLTRPQDVVEVIKTLLFN